MLTTWWNSAGIQLSGSVKSDCFYTLQREWVRVPHSPIPGHLWMGRGSIPFETTRTTGRDKRGGFSKRATYGQKNERTFENKATGWRGKIGSVATPHVGRKRKGALGNTPNMVEENKSVPEVQPYMGRIKDKSSQRERGREIKDPYRCGRYRLRCGAHSSREREGRREGRGGGKGMRKKERIDRSRKEGKKKKRGEMSWGPLRSIALEKWT